MGRSFIRLAVLAMCLSGLIVFAGAVVAPLLGLIVAAWRHTASSTEPVAICPAGTLFLHSVLLSLIAAAGSLLLAIAPVALFAHARGRAARVCTALCFAGLLIPPQVYAYAWDVATSPAGPLHGWLPTTASATASGSVIRAGLISAAWLWPLAAMIITAGWRMTGQGVYRLALLDATPTTAYLRAVLPSLQPFLIAAGGTVFVVTLIEYAIPHLCLARVYSTELLLLVDAGAPYAQIVRVASSVMLIVLCVVAIAGWSVRRFLAGGVELQDDESSRPSPRGERFITAMTALVWLGSVGFPIAVLIGTLHHWSAWREAWLLFTREWGFSLLAAGLAALMTFLVTVVLVLLAEAAQWRRLWIPAALCGFVALVPPAALGVGFIVLYNRAGLLGEAYDRTPLVWALSLTARFAAIAVAVVWISGRQQVRQLVHQARADGAGPLDVLGYILLPLAAPLLLASVLSVLLLAMFEVVVTHLVGPVGFSSIALALLNQMHYGRDDVVIATSLTVCIAGFILALICGTILKAKEPR